VGGIFGAVFGGIAVCLAMRFQEDASAKKTQEKLPDANQAPQAAAPLQGKENPLQGRKIVIIVGATGNIGRETALTALAKGCLVIATSRTPSLKGLTPDLEAAGQLQIVATPDALTHNPKFWEEFFVTHLKNGDEVTVVSTVGGAHGKDLRHLNVAVPVAIFTGLAASQKQRSYSKMTARQCSSIAAALKIGDYGRTKLESDLALLNIKDLNVQVFRIGYVLDDITGYGEKANAHAYTPLEIVGSQWPVQPVMGDVSIPLQPVDIRDVAEALVSPSDIPERIVYAVGPETIPQGNLYKFYCDLLGVPFRPMAVSLEAAALLAKHHPKGHFAPYAVEYCSKFKNGEPVTFSHKELENLLGRPLTKVEDIYLPNLDKLVVTQAPVGEHLKEIVVNMATKPDAARDTAKAVAIQIRFMMAGNPQEPPKP